MIEPRRHCGELRHARIVAVGQRIHRILRAFDQALGVREPRVLGEQLLPFVGIELERIELAHLPLELLALGRKRRRVGFERRELLPDVLPAAPRGGDSTRCGAQSGIGIEQRALRRRAQQRLVFVLAVNIDQMLARLAQLRERHGAAVDERARAAAAVDHAPHQTRAIVTRKFVVGEPGLQRLERSGLELGADLAFLGALPHDARVAALAEHHRQRVDQDRFAGAGFAGEHREAGRELEIHPVDDHEIANVQRAQHGSKSGE